MAVIHIETIPLGRGEYEFIQTWIEYDQNLNEQTFTESHPDRMYAAINNIGYAAKWLNESRVDRGVIHIQTDTDGKDTRYGGEHNYLYNVLHDPFEYKKNRPKYAIIFSSHVKFLDRIQELLQASEICIVDGSKKEVEPTKALEIEVEAETVNNQFLRRGLLRLSLDGDSDVIKCLCCHEQIKFTIESFPMSVWNLKGNKTIPIANSKKLIEYFLDLHAQKHNVKS